MTYFVPQDATWVRNALENAATCSQGDSSIGSRAYASVYGFEAVVLSLFASPELFIKGCIDSSIEFSQCNLSASLTEFGSGIISSFQSLLFSLFGICYVAFGILFPRAAYSAFDPSPAENLSERVRELTQQVNDLSSYLSEQSTDLETSTQRVLDLERQNTTLSDQVRTTAEERDQAQNTNTSLTENLNTLRNTNQNQSNQINELTENVNSRNNQISELQNTIQIQTNKNNQLTEKVNNVTTDRNLLQTTSQNQLNQINELTNVRNNNQEQINQLSLNIKSKNIELNKFKNTNDELEKQLHVLNEKYSQLEETNNLLTNEREKYVNENSDIKESIQSLNTYSEETANKNDKLESDLQNALKVNEFTQNRITELEKQLQIFEEKQEELELELLKKDLPPKLLNMDLTKSVMEFKPEITKEQLTTNFQEIFQKIISIETEPSKSLQKAINFVLEEGAFFTYTFTQGEENISLLVNPKEKSSLNNFFHMIENYAEFVNCKECTIEVKEIEEEKITPTKQPIKIQQKGGVYDSWVSWINHTEHPSSLHKYRVALDQYVENLGGTEKLNETYQNIYSKWNETGKKDKMLQGALFILETLLCPVYGKTYSDARGQYSTFIYEALRSLITSEAYKKIRTKPLEELTDEEKLVRNLVRDVCIVRWAGADLFPYLQGITDLTRQAYKNTLVEVPEEIPLTAKNFSEQILEINKEIQGAPLGVKQTNSQLQYQKFTGAIGKADYTATENVPQVQSRMEYKNENNDTFEVIYSRHGTPNVAGGLASIFTGMFMRGLRLGSMAPSSGETIAPDYEEFLLAASERNEPVLFISHQRYLPNTVENESDRVKELLKMQDLSDNVFVFVQNVDGAIFNIKSKDTFADLKKEMIDAFYNPDTSGCILPKAFEKPPIDQLLHTLKTKEADVRKSLLGLPNGNGLVGEEYENLANSFKENKMPENLSTEAKKQWKMMKEAIDYKEKVLPKLLDDVHKILFKDKDKVETLEEWQSFILEFYVFQKMDFKFRIKRIMEERSGKAVNKMYYTTPCKDFLDRGGNMALVETRTHDYMMGKQNDKEVLEERAINLLGPPILVKKKEAIPHRIEPGLKLNNRLEDMVDRTPLTTYRFEGGWRPTKLEVKKPKDQTAVPTIKNAKTPSEVLMVLKALKASSDRFEPKEHRAVFEVSKAYINDEKYNQNEIFKQVNKDILRSAMRFEGNVLTGKEGSDAKYVYEELRKKDLPHEKALEILSLFQQGVGADLWCSLKESLDSPDNGLAICQINQEKNVSLDLTVGDKILIQCSIGFCLKAEDIEKTTFYREKPYAALKGYVSIDWTDKAANWSFGIDSVNES